jgi:hypothetical protein
VTTEQDLTKAKAKTGRMTTGIIGNTGLRHTGGYITEEFLPELAGAKGHKAYREMSDNDATVGAILFAITSLIRQAEWSVQAVDDSPEAEDAKTFVEEVMHDMTLPWRSMVSEACSMFPYGFAPMEIIWKRRLGPDADEKKGRSAYSDGKIGIRAISLRAQATVARWEIDPEDGGILGLHQQPWSGPQIFIPREKMLLFRTTDVSNNPEGRSILRTAYRAYYFKKRIEEIEAIGIERDMAGLPVAYIPARYFEADADPHDKQVLAAWQSLVTTIRRDQREGVVLPSDRDSHGNLAFELKLLSTAGSRTFDTTKVIDRYDRAIATSVLADFIFLGQQAVGSFALSSDKTALFATAIGAFTGSMADCINRDLLPKLWRYNGLNPEYMPSVVCGDIEQQNLAELAEFLSKLTGAGAQVFPDRELENHLRTLAGLPLAPEEGSDDDMRRAMDEEMARQAAETGAEGASEDEAATLTPDEAEAA